MANPRPCLGAEIHYIPASREKPRLSNGLQVAAAKLGSGIGTTDERRLYIIPELDL